MYGTTTTTTIHTLMHNYHGHHTHQHHIRTNGGNLMVRGLKMQMHLKLQACLFFSLFFLLYTDGETLSKLIMTHHQHQHHIRTNGGGTMVRGLEMQMHLKPQVCLFFSLFFSYSILMEKPFLG